MKKKSERKTHEQTIIAKHSLNQSGHSRKRKKSIDQLKSVLLVLKLELFEFFTVSPVTPSVTSWPESSNTF